MIKLLVVINTFKLSYNRGKTPTTGGKRVQTKLHIPIKIKKNK
jgi:hypothetical protein